LYYSSSSIVCRYLHVYLWRLPGNKFRNHLVSTRRRPLQFKILFRTGAHLLITLHHLKICIGRSSGNNIPIVHSHRHTVFVHVGCIHELRGILRRLRLLGDFTFYRCTLHTRIAVPSDEHQRSRRGSCFAADTSRLIWHDRRIGIHQGKTDVYICMYNKLL